MAQLNKKIMAVAVAVLFCVAASLWQGAGPQQELAVEEAAVPQALAEAEEELITVYVSGAVANPGLHEIPAGSRAVQAIAAAGGMTEEANSDKVNLAKVCKDGMQINVPRLSAKELRRLRPSAGQQAYAGLVQEEAPTVSEPAQALQVRLSTATLDELTELPGVGEATARRIVEYRSAHGFAQVEDIMKVKGIGKAKFNKMRPYLAL